MSSQSVTPLRYDPAGVMNSPTGLSPADLTALAPRLEQARAQVLIDYEKWRSGDSANFSKHPLDAGFVGLPDELLSEYRTARATSRLQRILATAQKLTHLVDRVVVLGIGGSYMGARALFESCCHPYHNELSRAERGGYPRLYFAGNNLDNDATQGMLDLLSDRPTRDVEDRWAIVVISKSGATLETAVALRQFLAVLRRACDEDSELIADLVVPITGSSGRLFELGQALGCEEIFPIPEGIGGRYGILSAAGLLPAAMLGLDVVRLLEGAAAMNAHFRTAPVVENIVLRYAGVGHLMETLRGTALRVLSLWGNDLEAVGLWYDQLLSESLVRADQAATPLSMVSTRDLHSRGQQHQHGRRDRLITNVIVEQPRRDRLRVGESEFDQDELNAFAERSLPEIMQAALCGTRQTDAAEQRPTADLYLPRIDEAALGQFFQMMMLATAVEGELAGVNPYGQPGVEAYKKQMNAFLRNK